MVSWFTGTLHAGMQKQLVNALVTSSSQALLVNLYRLTLALYEEYLHTDAIGRFRVVIIFVSKRCDPQQFTYLNIYDIACSLPPSKHVNNYLKMLATTCHSVKYIQMSCWLPVLFIVCNTVITVEA